MFRESVVVFGGLICQLPFLHHLNQILCSHACWRLLQLFVCKLAVKIHAKHETLLKVRWQLDVFVFGFQFLWNMTEHLLAQHQGVSLDLAIWELNIA